MSYNQPTRSELFGVAFAVALTLVAFQAWMNPRSAPEAVLPPALIDRTLEPVVQTPHVRSAAGEPGADGDLPDGVTVFDDGYPAIANLKDNLGVALRSASQESGITFEVSSGWRSRSYQQQLFDQAVAEYGSEDEAARWAARPGTSIHEAGEAADISNSSATDWLSRHGDDYGLCQTYANEPWHYELRPDAADDGCPAMYADAAHDPRMR